MSKSETGRFSDAWLDRTVIEYLTDFILMHSGTSTDDVRNGDARDINETHGKYQRSNDERSQLSETIFYIACQKQIAMLETYVRLIVDLLTENHADSRGSKRLWNMLLSMMTSNRLVCDYFCTVKGFPTSHVVHYNCC